jgi:hypothetical protein
MIDYLKGAIPELIERACTLKTKIPRYDLSPEFTSVAQRFSNEIDNIVTELRGILEKLPIIDANEIPQQMRLFRRAVEGFQIIENIGVAALNRANEDDKYLNKIVQCIRTEIKYPLMPPAVSCLASLRYYHIHQKFSLLFVPLLESQFLLHLPDLYHELAHPIIAQENDPVTEPFQHSVVRFINEVHAYICQEMVKNRRRTGPQEFGEMLVNWKDSWIWWAIELFATFTLGPAYVWSHLHLSAKFAANPYLFNKYDISTHPPDNTRMTSMLLGLKIMDFKHEADDIEEKWSSVLHSLGATKEPEYNVAFPDHIMEQCVVRAHEGISQIGCRVANQDSNDRIHSLLNAAWKKFWNDPKNYPIWERKEVRKLRSELLVPMS